MQQVRRHRLGRQGRGIFPVRRPVPRLPPPYGSFAEEELGAAAQFLGRCRRVTGAAVVVATVVADTAV
ncbi:hypothetical protein GCM10010260_04690 [Streptomyces filipinensis]|uniref:Uncharacterized protein n=1 Tax=Streptomyces filipinensis TaxID=66887 RepID=A0A918I5G0_9ACTN|nr:hypothetical protein GCM10010260_04690 [Streptomyces filipinensis]